ncbi:MAG: hypothetical protein OXK80_00170 [Bdellovibrionales bacterium]|nr:hypothetical protein [Bdellovibrionales bacterium]
MDEAVLLDFIKVVVFFVSYFTLMKLSGEMHTLEQEKDFLKTNKSYRIFVHPVLRMVISIVGIGLFFRILFKNTDSFQDFLSSVSYALTFFIAFLCGVFYRMNLSLKELIQTLKADKEYKMPKSIQTFKKGSSAANQFVFILGSLGVFALLVWSEATFGIPSYRTCMNIFISLVGVYLSLWFYRFYINPKRFLETPEGK